MTGWIRWQRGTLNHHAFKRPPFSEAEAWLWLIENAAYEDTRHRVGKTVQHVSKGSMYITLRQLAKEWKWKSDCKVRGFFKLLENEKMIVKNTTLKKTQITICNYSLYQDVERKVSAKLAQSQRTKVTSKQINKDITLLGGRDKELYNSLGKHYDTCASYPSMLVLSEPINWLDNGCDMDMDILPTVKALSSKAKRIMTWAYFRDAVFEARDKRLVPAPEPTKQISKSQKPMGIAEMAMRQSRELKEKENDQNT